MMTSMRTCLAAALVLSAGPGAAGTLEMWNFVNVAPGGPVNDDEAAASVVFDRPVGTPGATSNGQIFYQAPEGGDPGLRVSNDAYTTGQGSFDGCILASSTAECDSGFQSGKRFKQQFTNAGPIDLVFDVSDIGGDAIYQVFHRAVNLTGRKLSGLSVEVGFGIGDDFVRAGSGGGVGFSLDVQLGPDNLPAFTQFPFGLFGDDAQPNPNPEFTLDGFFDGDSRAGFALDAGPSLLQSSGFYGTYDDLFGNWLSREMAPDALLWDWALGAADPLVMAWDNGVEWELRRGIDDTLDGVIGSISVNDVFALDEDDWQTFGYDDLAAIQAVLGVDLFQDAIEDLANLNLNYAIVLGDDLDFDQFTLRTSVTPVPLPFGGPLLVAGLGGLALMRRRKAG